MENPFELIDARLDRIESILTKLVDLIDRADRFDEDERISRKELCRLYKISLTTVHECMNRGLPFEKIGKRTLFKRAAADEFFKKFATKRPGYK